MNKELSSIVITLVILTAIFGIWFFLRYHGVLVRKSADSIALSRSQDNALCLTWKDPYYGINGFSSWYCRDSTLHLEVNLSHRARNSTAIRVDTAKIRYIEIYGQVYAWEDIPNK